VSIDYEAEGLLDGLDSKEEREARIDLLDQLTEDGVALEELKSAAEADRLALLPVERVLASDAKYTRKDVAEKSGLSEDLFGRQWQALGLPAPGPDEPYFSDADLENAKRIKQLLDAGLDEEGILDVSRVVGEGIARIADAGSSLVGRAFLRPGDTERDVGLRYATVTREMAPMLADQLRYVLGLHLREQVKREVVDRASIASGELPGTQEMAVGFADLVDFTKLGEHLPPEELGGVAGRLAAMASELVEPPVRLVKTIGDAAMFVSPEPAPLVATALDLVRAADEEGVEFPPLRSGIASGFVLERGGDWYGHPVNLASRVTTLARPGSVLTTSDVRKAVEDGDYRWSNAGRRKIKGVREPVSVWRVRPDGRDAPDTHRRSS
jgi:adenylate cyclase